jgi:hypothetical protein
LAWVILGISAACGLAQTEPWPPEVLVSPQNPSTSSIITLTISDTWSTDCVPRGIVSTQIQGRSIYITVGQVMYLLCNRKPTFWQEQESIGPLAAGCYDIHVGHGTQSQLVLPFAKAATFCVGSAAPSDGVCLPRPAYDSGWVVLPETGTNPATVTLTHNVGGDVDDYVVDLQRRESRPGAANVTNRGIGDTFFYSELTTRSIKLTGPLSPKDMTISLRVRIWVHNCDRICPVDFAPYERLGQGLSPSNIRPGQTLRLTFGVANGGTEAIAPGWRIQYFASRDPAIRPADDYLLYETTADFGVGPGQRLGLQEAFTFPGTVPAGQYYIGWIFDPLNEVCESDESNNTGVLSATSARLTVTGAAPQ